MTRTENRVTTLRSAIPLSCLLLAAGLSIGQSPTRSAEYVLLVASEAADQIAVVRFGSGGGRVEKTIETGIMPNDIDGPHGLAVGSDRRSYFVSLAHGQPFGSVWKYSAEGTVLARATLGMFPATISVTPDGEFLTKMAVGIHGHYRNRKDRQAETTGKSLRIRSCRAHSRPICASGRSR